MEIQWSIKVLAKSINININSEQRIVIKTEYHNYGKPDKTEINKLELKMNAMKHNKEFTNFPTYCP